jgi:sugar-specific transcriptional regulator TrmB
LCSCTIFISIGIQLIVIYIDIICMNEQLLETLEKIGLSSNESSVYLAALRLGKAKVAALARAAGVKRTTVYSVVETLKQKGLMRIDAEGLKNVYVAEHPNRLEVMLEERNREFTSLLPEFRALYNLEGADAILKYYDTPEAVRNVYRELLDELRMDDNYYVIGDPERYDTTNEKFFKWFIKERVKIRMNAKMLLTYSDLALEYKKFEKNYGEEVRLLPQGVSLDTNTVITDKRVIMHQIIPPYMSIVIENKSIIKLQKTLFELLWEKY